MTAKKRVAGGKTWMVTIPITGIAYATVIAESAEEAIDVALYSSLSIESWEAHREICRGNTFSGMQNRAEAQEE